MGAVRVYEITVVSIMTKYDGLWQCWCGESGGAFLRSGEIGVRSSGECKNAILN
jgi:hypothetical protein